MNDYKVLSLKGKNPEYVEERLKGFSKEGWSAIGFCGKHNSWLILERKIEEKEKEAEPKPTEETKEVEEPKPTEETKKVEEPKPTEENKQVEKGGEKKE